MKFSKYILAGALFATMGMTSCVGDLNVDPENPTTKTELNSREDYLGVLARAYGGLVFEGGVDVNDGGRAVYSRLIWNLEEMCTDEVVMGDNWKDAGIPEIKSCTAGSDCAMLYEAFSRFNYQIALCNSFLKVIDGGAGYFTADQVKQFKAEAHVLRDLSYYHMIDIFGKGPWISESHVVGAIPPTYDRKQLFDAVVEDLLAAIPNLLPAKDQIYGRVSREGAKALLAKLYLNAGVYTGTPMWQECAAVCNDIASTIAWNSTLEYKYLFCATNDKYVGNNEILWGIPQDASTITTFGGTTYLAGGCWNSKLDKSVYVGYGCGVETWAGPRLNPRVSENLASNDKRRLIYEGNLHADVLPEDMAEWTEDGGGYMCVKYVYTPENDYTNASGAYTTTTIFNDTDFPLFRLADVYLMLAECQLNGVACDGLDKYNKVRIRAGLSAVGSYTADDLLKERMCELYWEGHRRSDLVRFGKLTGSSYNWEWKGGVYDGASIPDYRAVYAIPMQFVETLGQNPGYAQ